MLELTPVPWQAVSFFDRLHKRENWLWRFDHQGLLPLAKDRATSL